ncbi:EscU/YscU/HrcU family type III secretion system export apparatus switch protein [Glaciimonas immobilis]|uniref:Type III secretion protein U n=1 Tax=Glaciimonas immobilis TaxID=728004 RepID=A0A840RQC7_9BURK|nr:EscU/YscU/HrcU family type III secretion system export apparatus switch protein [Glaciimonas immobilis]KAF3999338.1 EscU/YscU/HrcU family type III secretion system export apparatus switch protein [Glaciimonas immobilis]MBB5198820.1 type III secretion protein U [Glaciimonas immobilis]
MSAASKTEKPSIKKKKDAAKRGQSFKARDLVVACLTFCGVFFVIWLGSLAEIGAALIIVIRSGFNVNLHHYVAGVMLAGLKVIAPIILLSILATAVPSLIQSGFSLAGEALKVNFGAINPMKGFKKIFSLRTVKDFIKTLLYLISFGAAAVLAWWWHQGLLFSQIHASVFAIVDIWGQLIISLVLISLACVMIILIFDALAEFFLHLKDLRMDKQEVRRENKDQEGDPMIKTLRRQEYQEMLSPQEMDDIKDSKMIIANPTHIAIGIYYKPEVSPIPYVSVRQSNQRALAVRRYAEKIGVPVIVDVALARRIYHTHKIYSMVEMDVIYPVVHLLIWLQEVELAGMSTPAPSHEDAVEGTANTGTTDSMEDTKSDNQAARK